jgi:hypothetical protein
VGIHGYYTSGKKTQNPDGDFAEAADGKRLVVSARVGVRLRVHLPNQALFRQAAKILRAIIFNLGCP